MYCVISDYDSHLIRSSIYGKPTPVIASRYLPPGVAPCFFGMDNPNPDLSYFFVIYQKKCGA